MKKDVELNRGMVTLITTEYDFQRVIKSIERLLRAPHHSEVYEYYNECYPHRVTAIYYTDDLEDHQAVCDWCEKAISVGLIIKARMCTTSDILILHDETAEEQGEILRG